jgi:hypothetical protein
MKAFGLQAVPSGASGFLLVVLERPWRSSVHHVPDVGPIDAHAERDGRDDDVGAFAEERILVAAALGV